MSSPFPFIFFFIRRFLWTALCLKFHKILLTFFYPKKYLQRNLIFLDIKTTCAHHKDKNRIIVFYNQKALKASEIVLVIICHIYVKKKNSELIESILLLKSNRNFMNFWGTLKFANNQSRKIATKDIKLRPRLLIETSNYFYFRPFMDYGSIQKPNKAWRNSTEFHLITQFFRHPQNNRKISFVLTLAWRVFRFSLKEIGNLLGRLAICRFLFNCPKLKRPIATLPDFFPMPTRGRFLAVPKNLSKNSHAKVQRNKETKFQRDPKFTIYDSNTIHACLFEGAELRKSRSVWN